MPNPLILVEVLSPSTRHIDASAKLAGYFSLPSMARYLIVDPDKPLVIHHARREGETTIMTRILTSGPIPLDPPGIEVFGGGVLPRIVAQTAVDQNAFGNPASFRA